MAQGRNVNPEGIVAAPGRVLTGVWMDVWLYKYTGVSFGVMLCCVGRVFNVSPHIYRLFRSTLNPLCRPGKGHRQPAAFDVALIQF